MEKQTTQARDALHGFLSEGTCAEVCERYRRLAKDAQEADFGGLDRDVVVIDTETTGFSLNHDELIQIAAARMDRGHIREWFVTFVNPGQPVPEEIVQLTGITDEDVAEAPGPEEAVSRLVDFVGASDLVAHNAEFDCGFVTKGMFGAALLQNTWIDSLDLARIALPRLKSHRLIDLVRAFEAPVSTHRADADVEALCAVYRILLAGAAAMPRPLLQAIADMADEAEWPTVKVFKGLAAMGFGGPGWQGADGKAGGRPEDGKGEGSEAPGTQAPQAPQAPPAPPAPPAPFSLRALRRHRTRELSLEAKPDADTIAADPQKELVFPSASAIEQAFGQDGLVSRLYENYEARAEQAVMAEKIRKAFSSSTNLAIEAGTGVGKSIAYLLPSVLVAKMNNIAVGIATKTNSLLDQLVYKELPLIAKAMADSGWGQDAAGLPAGKAAPAAPPAAAPASAAAPAPADGDAPAAPAATPAPPPKALDFTALKGFTHYPCLRRIDRIVHDGPRTRTVNGKPVSQAPSLAALLSFIEQSEYDDIDSLKIDYRALPRYAITTTSADCLRRRCPFYGTACFVHGARRRAEAADIVVTNHSLLFCDIAAEGGLLPPIRYWVVDEAHGAEAEARSAFSVELSAEEALRLSRRLASDDPAQSPFVRAGRQKEAAGAPAAAGGVRTAAEAALAATGAIAAMQAADAPEEGGTLLLSQVAKARRAAKEFDDATAELARHIKDLAFFNPNKRNKGYEVVELWINDEIRASETFAQLASYGRIFCDAAEKLISASQDVAGALEGMDEKAEAQREVASAVIGLKEALYAAETILFTAPPQFAYAAVLSSKQDRVVEKLQALLVNVGERLNETLFADTHSVVFTSATLTVADSFDSFEDALGLNESESSQTATCQLGSSYDFDSQMTVYVASDVPEPNSPDYLQALQRLLVQVHLAQQGSMLTLFTNRKEMEKCFEEVQPVLKAQGLRLVCQKWGVSAKGLRDDFLADEHLSLFALKSFWEGFDAPGVTLKGVVIPKLPFAKPTDPLSCERALRDPHAWAHYVLPAAVLETKQAVGRLIRSAEDTGCIILADQRLLTKGYGKTFLRSLPSQTIKTRPTAAIARELAGDRDKKPLHGTRPAKMP